MTNKPEWQRWYNSKQWKALRKYQLAREPLCRMCGASGRLTPATVVDHVTPHKGDYGLFLDGDNLNRSARRTIAPTSRPRSIVDIVSRPVPMAGRRIRVTLRTRSDDDGRRFRSREDLPLEAVMAKRAELVRDGWQKGPERECLV